MKEYIELKKTSYFAYIFILQNEFIYKLAIVWDGVQDSVSKNFLICEKNAGLKRICILLVSQNKKMTNLNFISE